MIFPVGSGLTDDGEPSPRCRWIYQRQICLIHEPNEIRSLRNAGTWRRVLHNCCTGDVAVQSDVIVHNNW